MTAYRLDLKPQEIGDTWSISFQNTDANGNAVSLPNTPYSGTFTLKAQSGLTLLTCSTADTSPTTLVITPSTGALVLTVIPSVTGAIDGLTYPFPVYELTIVDTNGVRSTLFEGICPLQV